MIILKDTRFSARMVFGFLLVVLIISTIPFLGEALFYSKGEPREAVVAVSMLNSGNWILPVSNGDVIPYKPPFMAMCIALFSLFVGHVTEFTSRLPSALALIGLVLWTYKFLAMRVSIRRAFVTSLVLFTSFEVFRAGFACRVDMMLTFFIVGALYSLYSYYERGFRGLPWLAILMMGLGTLTKGPVAIVLPCGVTWVFCLLQGKRFVPVTLKLILSALIAMLIPLPWYILAYNQGGDEFLKLVIEENFGRMTGTMSYESHVNPFYYNFITVIAGYLPYTLLALLSLIPLARINALKFTHPRTWWGSFMAMAPLRKFALVATVVIFVFYCIPASKRSVYLLPIYPFIAMFLTEYIAYLVKLGHKSVKTFAAIMSILMIAVFALFVVIQCNGFPYSMLDGRHAIDNAKMVTALSQHLSLGGWLLVEIPVLVGIFLLMGLRRLPVGESFMWTLAVIVSFYWAFAGFYQPTVLNAKSDKPIATELNRLCPEGRIYAYVATPMMRFFSADFYTGDRIVPFEMAESEDVDQGFLVVGVDDARTFLPANVDKYDFYLIEHFKSRSADMRQQTLLLRFQKK